MDFREVAEQVKALTDIHSSDRAAGVTEATLQTFGSYLNRNEKETLSAFLSEDLQRHLLGGEAVDDLTQENFYTHVRDTLDLDSEQTKEYIAAVFNALSQAVTSELLHEILSEKNLSGIDVFNILRIKEYL